jgi:hypothetical protein
VANYYQATGEAASAAEIRSALDLFEARAQFDGPERAVHIRSPSIPDTSISILPMCAGAQLKLRPRDGGSLNVRPSASAGPSGCCPCPSPNEAGP